ncbi:hypothetical protein [Nonomuraea sp. NPDC049725]|uniref:hypothetical protein n=1 Tax=Nonomuraea sp. NPDC049725 TaxID=3154508 RepID=UPI00341C2336
MTRYTEHDLRTVFADYSDGGPGRPRSPRLDELVRRGRARRRRARTTTGALLAGAAAALTVFVTVPLTGGGVDAVRVAPGVELPEEITGGNQERLRLIASAAGETLGDHVTVTFRPTSVRTAYSVRCADPDAWVLVRSVGDADGWSDLGRCGERTGPGPDSQYHAGSVRPDWLRAQQAIEVWVFPAGAPVGDPRFHGQKLVADPEALKKVAGTRPGRWAVAVYDQPG